jgi:hypothetical protein
MAVLGITLAVPVVPVGDISGRSEVRSVPLAFAAGPAEGVWETDPLPMPATVVGLSWSGGRPERAWVRSSSDGRRWEEWIEIGLELDAGPDPGTAEAAGQRAASEPIYVGRAQLVQYRVEARDPSGLRGEVVGPRRPGLLQRVRLPWKQAEADASPDRPALVSRAEWGGDACLGEDPIPPHYVRRPYVMFLHHTATTNDYTAEEAADIVYGICRYHVGTLGWWDIGYNFLIDQYGTIYEGRAGGVERGVRGAHTGGFNSYSTGVALIGNHVLVEPTPEAQDALERLAAWKLDLHHVDPVGETTLRSLGSSRYEEGVLVTFPNLAGHRTASLTSCPGDACFVLLGGFRQAIDAVGGEKIYGGWPVPDPIPGNPGQGYHPASFEMSFTSSMSWNLEVHRGGQTLLAASGLGEEAQVTWDGTVGGEPLPMGFYEVTVEAVPSSGPAPRPVQDTFQLGSFLPPFVDDDGSVHEIDITAIAASGISKGCNPPINDRYCPSAPVSRAQMASFLVRALGLAPVSTDYFSDDEGSVHAADIDALAAAGITKGCAPDRFCPADPVTREQMAAFLVRALGLTDDGGEDWFSDDEASVFEGDIDRLAGSGITKGCNPPDNDRFCPRADVSRAQMASFLARGFLAGSS